MLIQPKTKTYKERYYPRPRKEREALDFYYISG